MHTSLPVAVGPTGEDGEEARSGTRERSHPSAKDDLYHAIGSSRIMNMGIGANVLLKTLGNLGRQNTVNIVSMSAFHRLTER